MLPLKPAGKKPSLPLPAAGSYQVLSSTSAPAATWPPSLCLPVSNSPFPMRTPVILDSVWPRLDYSPLQRPYFQIGWVPFTGSNELVPNYVFWGTKANL